MKNTPFTPEKTKAVVMLGIFYFVFLGAEYLFDNTMTSHVTSHHVVLMQGCILGISAVSPAVRARSEYPDHQRNCTWDHLHLHSAAAPLICSQHHFRPSAFLPARDLRQLGPLRCRCDALRRQSSGTRRRCCICAGHRAAVHK